MRPSQRTANDLRPIQITRHYTKHAEGSVLVEFGDTRVLCNASVTAGSVPRFLKGSGQGWVTAEYSMLPRATHQRTDREASKGQQSGRTLEIQRLIGRSLRACVNLKHLEENTITVDCDVIQADGGTRTAAITGGCIALIDAIQHLRNAKMIKQNPLVCHVAAVSVGIYQGTPILDLDYAEDSQAQTDMNVVMDDRGQFIEVQGTAESQPFTHQDLLAMTALAQNGIQALLAKQKEALGM